MLWAAVSKFVLTWNLNKEWRKWFYDSDDIIASFVRIC